MDRLLVATLNIRNLADRWDERLPLLLADMAALQPDLIGLNEVVYPLQQDRLLGAAGEGRYEAVRGWAGRPEYGNSLLVRRPCRPRMSTGSTSGPRDPRTACSVALPGGARLVFAVTHLHHVPRGRGAPGRPGRPAPRLARRPRPHDALIVAGDFNAEPERARLRAHDRGGLRVAYARANGEEPAVTWPSGLSRPGMDTDGEPGCLDYLWLRGAARARCAPRLRPPGRRRPHAVPVGPRRASPRTWSSARAACDAATARGGRRPLRLAHRGDSRVAPENTLEALLAAMRIPGCDGVEFDVRLSRDGVPVLAPRRDARARPGTRRARGRPRRPPSSPARGPAPRRRSSARSRERAWTWSSRATTTATRPPASCARRAATSPRAGRRLLLRAADAGRDGRPAAGVGALAQRGWTSRRATLSLALGLGCTRRRRCCGERSPRSVRERTTPDSTWRYGPCSAGRRSSGWAGWASPPAVSRLPRSTGSVA